MKDWLSPTNGAVFRKWKPNPTCAGPYPCRSRCQNLGRALARPGGWVPGQCSNGLSRRGQAAVPRGVACRLGCCASLPPLGEAWVLPLKDPHRETYGYSRCTVLVNGVITRGKWLVHQTDEVPRRLGWIRVRPTYKSVTKWPAYAAERIGCPLPRPP